MRSNFLRMAILVVLVSFVGACGRSPRQDFMPWCGPGERAVLTQRRTGWAGASPHISSWVDSGGTSHDPNDFAKSVIGYMAGTPEAAAWPVLGRLKLMPYDNITIVSITPTVALLQPHDYGPLNDQTLGDISVGERYDASTGAARPGMRVGDWINLVRVGVSVADAPDLKWVCPDMQVAPTLVSFQNGRAEVPLPNGKLVLVRNGNQVDVTRE